MPQNPRAVTPINWDALVEEALRRRKADKLTQREHAALASVSIPTIVGFDRGERTLSLAKAFDILRVVGLFEEPDEAGTQEAFVQDAFARWRDLTAKLPSISPARFPHGWYRFDYALGGDLKPTELSGLVTLIEKAEIRHTSWPMFVTMTRAEFEPREQDGMLECWIVPEETGVERMTTDAAHCDFWRADLSGRFFLIRGYAEDSQDVVPPGTIFDTTLPIWRIAEGLLHAARMAALFQQSNTSEITVKFRALFTGLSGRTVRALAGGRDFFDSGRPAKSDETMLQTSLPADKIEADLTGAVHPLVATLYERFGLPMISEEFVRAEIKRFTSGRF